MSMEVLIECQSSINRVSIEGINGHSTMDAFTCTKYTHDRPGMKESAHITYPLLFWQITGIFWGGGVNFGTFDLNLIDTLLWLNQLSSTFDNIF